MPELAFTIYSVSSHENLIDALNRLAKNDDWEVFQVLPENEKFRERIVLKAKKKRRVHK